MLRTTRTKTFDDFVLNDSLPTSLSVRDTAPLDSKTRFYSVIADYGWSEVILCGGSYRPHANSIARILGEFLDVPVKLVEVPDG